MNNPQWTQEQKQAIETRGRALLLSAGAGSGKTAVLVERIVSRLLDKDSPLYADQLVVVTFSNAAATEMKYRLQQRLYTLQKENTNNVLLEKQLQLLPYAKISTVHAFCYEIIQEHLWDLELPPDMHIGDERELEILFDDCLEETLELSYEKGDKKFLGLVDMLSTGRNDKAVKNTISTLYRFVRSHPFYTNWMDERLKDFDKGTTPEDSVWGKIILDKLWQEFSYAESLLRHGIAVAKQDNTVMEKYHLRLSEELKQVTSLLNLAEAGAWDKLYEAIQQVEFSSMPRVTKCDNIAIKEQAKKLRDQAKDIVEEIKKNALLCTSQTFFQDSVYLKRLIESLFSVVKDFDVRYLERKKEKKLLDFGDMEHFALAMLVQKQEKGYIGTALAEQLSEIYQEVLVDEYQDTNMIQDLIFRAISENGKHLFMVGDVKQSIYGFRQAMPEIFLKKKQEFSSCDVLSETGKIILRKNFRSRKEVTEGINYIFHLLMRPQVGGLTYGEEEQLIAGADYVPSRNCGCEFAILDMGILDDGEKTDIEVEADYVAGQIQEMVNTGYLIQDKGGMRPIKLSDIAILLRSDKGKAEVFQKALKQLSFESSYQMDKGFLHSEEIACVMALLRVINNPLLDVHLANAMMSPLFGFTAEDMAEITVGQKQLPLYLRIVNASGENEKCSNFLRVLGYMRTQASMVSTAQLLHKIYDETGIETVMRIQKNGKKRNLNLKLLVEYAIAYDQNGYKGVAGFVGFIDKLEESGGDLSPATTVEQGEDTVHIMSVHRSKGLEFPVVFLADCGKSFNKQELRNTTLLHAKLGFASMRRDNTLGVQYKTPHLNAVRIQAEQDSLSEEMRILYVAMTRAKEKFIATATISNLAKRIKSLWIPLTQNGLLETGLVSSAGGYSDWLIAALLHHPSGVMLRSLAEVESDATLSTEAPFSVKIVEQIKEKKEAMEEKVFTETPSEQWLQELQKRDRYHYPYYQHTITATKLAISSIGKEEIEKYRFYKRPLFTQEGGATGAERGKATHKFMQFADYKKLATEIESELDRLERGGFLTPKEKGYVDIKRIQRFTTTPLYARIMSADKVYREYGFLAEVGKEELEYFTDEVQGDCRVAVQGIADCILIEQGTATIIDYKTDFAHTVEELGEKYATQLKIYKMLLPESLGVPIKDCILYSFHLNDTIHL